MNPREPFRSLLIRTLATLLVGSVCVGFSFFFVDRTVAYFVHDHEVNHIPLFLWLTFIPMAFNVASPIVTVWAMVRLAFAPLTRFERTAFAAGVSLMIAVAFEYYLKYLAGRYWPETWVQDNPSLISYGEYGFHPFHFGEWYGSFPSGHTARTFAVMAVMWTAFPRTRLAALGTCFAVMIGLVGMNYHFVGDCIGGAMLGGIVGTYTAACFGLAMPAQASREPVP